MTQNTNNGEPFSDIHESDRIFDNEKPPKILWVNQAKKRRTLSNTTFKEDIIFQAHTLEQPSYIPYYPKSYVEKLKQQIAELSGDATGGDASNRGDI